MKIKKGDKVRIMSGKDITKEGKVLSVDRKTERIIVENVNIVKKHLKPGKGGRQQGGIISKEAPINVSKVMYLHKGVPTRLGYKVTTTEKNGKSVTLKQRIAKSTGEVID